MIKFIIPSYDRACQLHLFFESILENFYDYTSLDFTVLYRASDKKFAEGYERLIGLFPELKIRWVKEKNFQQQVTAFLDGSRGQLIGWAVDDLIFYRPFYGSVDYITKLMSEDVWNYSFRLGLNTTLQNYMTGQDQAPLSSYALVGEKYVKYNWKVCPPFSNYGYYGSLDMTVYRSDDFYHLCADHSFNNPRALESAITNNVFTRNSTFRKYTLCGTSGHTFVNTINCVQETKIEAGLFHPLSSEELNDRYLDDYVIDLYGFDFSEAVTRGCHGELPISWRKKE